MNPVVEKLSQETPYSYQIYEFIYEFMGTIGFDQENCTQKLLHKAIVLGQDPIRLLFLMLMFANRVGGGKK